jgi:hypothetical protein
VTFLPGWARLSMYFLIPLYFPALIWARVAARRDHSVIHKTQRDAPLSREAPT